jgi:hypothetical protein
MPKAFDSLTSAKALEVREEQREKYRKNYLDEDYWAELAKVRGVRIPPYYTRPSDQEIKYWLKLGKVSYSQFVEAYGWKNSAEFEIMNPTHGMKILAGLILELSEENIRLKKLGRERCEEFELFPGTSLPPVQPMYKGQGRTARRLAEQIIS